MKFAIVFVALLAFAAASDSDKTAKLLKLENDVQAESFSYAIEVDNHIKAIQNGILKDKEGAWVVSGEYSFVDPNGEHVRVSYVADEAGYHPQVFRDDKH